MPPTELDADQRLMRSFAAREPGAADTLYRRFAGRIYGLGLVMLSRIVPGEMLLGQGLLPFVPGDLIKSALAALAFPAAWRMARRTTEPRA